VLERATARWPTNRDLLIALATMQRGAGKRTPRGARYADSEAYPDDREIAALALQLR
jgi:hypothetical protein